MKRTLKLTTLKPHKYGTRHLTAGEEYDAEPRHAVAMIAARKARVAPKQPRALTAPSVPQPAPQPEPQPKQEPSADSGIDALRQQAAGLGIPVDGRWGAVRLQYEIDQAKRRCGY